jgi:mono/diheme cytochrome c family protein
MRRFFSGFIAALVIIFLAGFLWLRLGFVDARADAPGYALERAVAMPALDASVRRHAPQARNPIDATDANLLAGMKVYQNACAGCHGDIHRPHAAFGDSFYPRAPQFAEDAPDMPDNQNFYIIQHGIRLSGMPAWRGSLKDEEMWQVTTFLSHMDKLPPQVAEQWKAMAAEVH